jgi:hypothetical protein
MQAEQTIPKEITDAVVAETAQRVSIVDRASSIVVRSAPELEDANSFLRGVKKAAEEIDERRRSMTKPIDESKKRIMDFFRTPLERLAEAERIVKRTIAGYLTEQERIRREAEARARAAAEAERRRLEEQAKRQEARGNPEAAETTREIAQSVTTPIAAPVERPAGLSMRKTYRAKVVDHLELVKAVAEGKAPLNLITPNQSALDGMARALKESFQVPGCRLETETGIASR